MVEHYTIPIFSAEWFTVNLITLGIIFLFLFYGLRVLDEHYQRVRLGYFLGAILLARLLFIHPYQIQIGIWDKVHSLPLHLCGISAIISFILLFRFNQFLYEFLILLGIPGAIQSLLTPELTLGYDKVLLFEYFVSHGGIILSGLFLTFVLGHAPRIKSWIRVIIASQVLLVLIHLFNIFLDSNYMYTRIKPIVDNILIIGEHPFYYIGFEFFGFLNIMLFYYLFIKFTNRGVENQI